MGAPRRSGPVPEDRVLHLSDPAGAATLLSEAAAATGRRWRVLPLATAPTPGPTASLRRAARGATWEAELLRDRLWARRVHVHSALAQRHAGWAFGERFALHLHGTDIRTRLYEPAHAAVIRDVVASASVVFYVTPDLRSHVAALRSDARLVPVPVPLGRAMPGPDLGPLLPPEAGDRGYVLFASRWGPEKGGDAQIGLARSVARGLAAHRGPVPVGIDWGQNAEAARDAGVHLLPRMPHARFRALVAGARVAIGQLTGVLGASELDALAADVPLVAPLDPRWYDGSDPALVDVPVRGASFSPDDAEGLAAAVLAALDGPAPAPTRPWVARHHSAASALQRVLAGYRSVGL